jgi:hypothetical protein
VITIFEMPLISLLYYKLLILFIQSLSHLNSEKVSVECEYGVARYKNVFQYVFIRRKIPDSIFVGTYWGYP